MQKESKTTWLLRNLFQSFIFTCLLIAVLLFLNACGSDKSEVVYQEPPIPRPIPPIYRNEPPTPPPQKEIEPPQITPDQCLADARRKYPWFTIREGNVPNAMTNLIGYRRAVITMGYQLRSSLDGEQWCAILNHELGHAVRNSTNEVIADYYSMIYLRQMLMNRRYRYDNRRMDRIALKQYRWLSRKPRSSTHPHPSKRLRIMRKAINRQKLTRADYY